MGRPPSQPGRDDSVLPARAPQVLHLLPEPALDPAVTAQARHAQVLGPANETARNADRQTITLEGVRSTRAQEGSSEGEARGGGSDLGRTELATVGGEAGGSRARPVNLALCVSLQICARISGQ